MLSRAVLLAGALSVGVLVAWPAGAEPDLPRPAPSFALTTLTGDSISNASLAGKVVLLDFWATWSGPARKTMAALQALSETFAEHGFVVVGISVDEGSHAKVQKYIALKHISYPIAVDSARSPAWDAFGVERIPSSFLLDREGRIVAEWIAVPTDCRQLAAMLEKLLAKKP